jgi:hypothetical protein
VRIQATPATTTTGAASAAARTYASATMTTARISIAPVRRTAIDTRPRRRGRAAAPATAPKPTAPSSSPYPPEPRSGCECATIGSSAQIEFANSMNSPARNRNIRNAGLAAT